MKFRPPSLSLLLGLKPSTIFSLNVSFLLIFSSEIPLFLERVFWYVSAPDWRLRPPSVSRSVYCVNGRGAGTSYCLGSALHAQISLPIFQTHAAPALSRYPPCLLRDVIPRATTPLFRSGGSDAVNRAFVERVSNHISARNDGMEEARTYGKDTGTGSHNTCHAHGE